MALTMLAGCGDDGSDDRQAYVVQAGTTMTVASPPITKTQFVARINKICRKAWVTVTDNFAVYSETQDRDLSKSARLAEAIQLSLLAGIDFHIFDNFRILGAPTGQEDEIEAIIGPFQESVELGWINRPRLRSFPQVAEHFDEYNQRARQYDLDDCLVDQEHLSRIKA
ncbi:MAG: hypothetical protein WA687_12565 [Solirubrobacterales bacterium]